MGYIRRILLAGGMFFACFSVAYADMASTSYVQEIVNAIQVAQPDWAQTNENAPDFIKNKPDIPTADRVEYVANKTTDINDDSTDAQYPTARAVNASLATKADADDVRFNTISTTQPIGTPPAGQVYIWFN